MSLPQMRLFVIKRIGVEQVSHANIAQAMRMLLAEKKIGGTRHTSQKGEVKDG